MELEWRTLNRSHDRKSFDCGNTSSNDWLKTKANQLQKRYATRVCVGVTADAPTAICAFFALSNRVIQTETVPQGEFKGFERYDVPTVLIGQLAVAEKHQGEGLGLLTMLEAFQRIFEVSQTTAVAAVEVDASNEAIVPFYENFGFARLIDNQRHMYLPMPKMLAFLESAGAIRRDNTGPTPE